MPAPRKPPTAAARAIVAVLFTIVFVGALTVPLYNRIEPSAAGVPFFYWFQIVWILASGIATAIAYGLGV
jgi:hypothetical protein